MSQENVEIVRRAIGAMSPDAAEDEARTASVQRLAPGYRVRGGTAVPRRPAPTAVVPRS